MKFTLLKIRKTGFLAFILGVCLFSTQTAFSQHRTWDGGAGTTTWSDAANWSGDVLPTATDSVTIIAGANVVVTANTTILKLRIFGSTGSQGKVAVNSGVTLTVNSIAATSPSGVTHAAVMLFGGIIENNGTMIISGRQSLDAMKFENPTSGTVSSTYFGTGQLTCNSTDNTVGGGSANTGASIMFVQTQGTAILELGGTYNFNPSFPSGTGPQMKSAIICFRGSAEIKGTGTITFSGNRRAIRVIPSAANETPNLIIGSGVTMNLSSTMNSAIASINTGIIAVDNNAASATSNLINKGTLNFSAGTAGTGLMGNPIGLTNGTSATTTSNFSNEGTININGAFTDATANVTLGGVFMGGASTTVGNSFTNTSTGIINFNTTSLGTSAKPFVYALVTPKNLFTNNGTITIGTEGSQTTSFQLGDDGTTVDNTGTITVGEGNIIGTAGTGNAAFNNNTSGIINFNLAAATSAISSNVAFTNAGGTLKGSGTFTNTGGNVFASGTIAPGQSPGTIILADAALALNGTYNAEIDGTAGAGVAGGNDQIDALTAAATVNVAGLTIATTFAGGYTPVVGNIIILINTNGGTITGTPTFTPALPAGWAATTTGGQVKIAYSGPLAVELTTFKATSLRKINLLTWATATETNNKGFDIQRQTAIGTWETLGFVKGIGSAATYKFEDKAPLSISYYRLRQLDFDGKETLSKVVTVSQSTKGTIKISPNPTSDMVNIQLSQSEVPNSTTMIALFDMTGRQILTQSTTAENFQLDLSNLAKGMYVLTAQSNNAIYQEKIIRQ